MSEYDYLTPGQAARILGVSTDTVGRYLESGVIEGHRTPGGHARLLRASVEAVRRHPAGRNVTVLRSLREV
jgi:excisionase family DNA binding protein